MHAIINDAARAYRGVIPADRWHEPYMSEEDLASEIRDGVHFDGFEENGLLIGIMGKQDKGQVMLIRHAYVRTSDQNRGIGTRLLRHLQHSAPKPVLVGTWAAAHWAIRFYQGNGFRLIAGEPGDGLLRKFWNIPEPQIRASVVLANDKWNRS
jgi:GNAT superfamily N-acetyltransferase